MPVPRESRHGTGAVASGVMQPSAIGTGDDCCDRGRAELTSSLATGRASGGNRYLPAAIAGVIVFAALFVYIPPLQKLLGTAGLPARYLVMLLPYPFIVLGADELRKWVVRRHSRRR